MVGWDLAQNPLVVRVATIRVLTPCARILVPCLLRQHRLVVVPCVRSRPRLGTAPARVGLRGGRWVFGVRGFVRTDGHEDKASRRARRG